MSRSASWSSRARSGVFQSGPSRRAVRSRRCTTVFTWTCSASLARARLAPASK
ncbi:putative Purine catabolism regulatory protein [Streptomyces aurantiacus JA 4570]|uniref:Putative Purine catabolism regulatory protein n=1 Tax=Streptomyces aurantiacus JA 4570 TaxID=1286094 RepID=S4ADW7_9ACTN|nr:putative Purine catabolism regulatory protein [Streptomyces aurantiacus JA 4570]